MALIKQYVNLDTDPAHPEYGPARDIQIPPNSVPNVGQLSRAEFWVEPEGGHTNTDEKYLLPNQKARLATTVSPLRLFRSAFSTSVTLPHVGGDRWVIMASKQGDRSSPKTGDTFETWRKLYYTVYYMGNDALNMFNGLEGQFKNAFLDGFIELENVAKTATLTEMARVDVTTRSVLGRPRMHFLGPPNAVVDLLPAGTGTLANKPFHVAILVVPQLYTLSEEAVSFAAINIVQGTYGPGFQLHRNPGPFCTAAQVSWTGRAATNHPANVVANTDFQIGFDFRAVAGLTLYLAANPANKYRLDLTLIKEATVMGYSIGNFCVVRTVDGTTDVLQTFTHEVGHGVGQAVQMETLYNPAGASVGVDAHPKWHTDNFGGRGPHCFTSGKLRTTTPPPLPAGLTGVMVWDSGTLCTMFFSGESHVDPDGKFCAECKPRMTRRDCGQGSMAAKNWNYVG